MKPTHITILIIAVTALAIWGIWYYFNKKSPSFDIAAYNSLGNNGIVQGNMDYPYCSTCNTNTSNTAGSMVGNSIDYGASGDVADPTYIARQAARMVVA